MSARDADSWIYPQWTEFHVGRSRYVKDCLASWALRHSQRYRNQTPTGTGGYESVATLLLNAKFSSLFWPLFCFSLL